MRSSMRKNMKLAISDVLETMFFQAVQFVEEPLSIAEWFSGNESLNIARLEFAGPVCGAYYLWVPSGLAAVMTANFLGLSEDGIDDQQQADTIKEALNMIGGHMLSHFDEQGAYQLGIPEMLARQEGMAPVGREAGEIFLCETDVMRLAAEIRLQ